MEDYRAMKRDNPLRPAASQMTLTTDAERKKPEESRQKQLLFYASIYIKFKSKQD